MAYSRITKTRNGAAAIAYARGNGTGHNDNKMRNAFVTGVNLLPETVQPFDVQMEKYWSKASTKNKNQVRRIIQSYSDRELNPNNPADITKANAIGVEFAQKAYPGYQAIVFTQIDGKSGLIHNHIVVNNVNMITLKGCTDEQTRFSYVKEWTNKIAGQYFKLDEGRDKNIKDKTTQNERRKRQENEKIAEENRSLPSDKQKPLKYIWKDDLKSRIKIAMKDAASRDDFSKRLTALGAECEIRTKKKGEEYIVYELTDTTQFGNDKVPQNLKAKGKKLGSDYDLECIDNQISMNTRSRKNGKTASVNKPAASNDAGRNTMEGSVEQLQQAMINNIMRNFDSLTVMEENTNAVSEFEETVKEFEVTEFTPAEESIVRTTVIEEPVEVFGVSEFIPAEEPVVKNPVTEFTAPEEIIEEPVVWTDVTEKAMESFPEEILEKADDSLSEEKLFDEAKKVSEQVEDGQSKKSSGSPQNAAETVHKQQTKEMSSNHSKPQEKAILEAKKQARRNVFRRDLPTIDWGDFSGNDEKYREM